MFDIGFAEMILLAAIALIAIGPKQLPEVARAVGKLLGEIKKTVGEVTSTVATARDETDRAIRKVTDDLTNAVKVQPDAQAVQVTKPAPSTEPIAPPSPIVSLPDHPGDPLWVIDPSIPNPNDPSPTEPGKPDGGEKT